MVDLFFFSSSFLTKDFPIFWLGFFYLFSPLSLILNLEETMWYDKIWQLLPASYTDHSHSHNVMWYSRRVTSYIIKDMMTLSI